MFKLGYNIKHLTSKVLAQVGTKWLEISKNHTIL